MVFTKLFRKTKNPAAKFSSPAERASASPGKAENSAPVKWEHPKILLIDMDNETHERLVGAGYNVSTGTFGTPYKVDMGDGWAPMIPNGDLPSDFGESEIVVVDLQVREIAEGPTGKKATSLGEKDWWAKCSSGSIDPRVRTMAEASGRLDRILDSGGIVIVFTAPQLQQQVKFARVVNSFGSRELTGEEDICGSWFFLNELQKSEVFVSNETGQEVFLSKQAPWKELLSRHVEGGRYSCTLEPKYTISPRWINLAENKFGAIVAAGFLRDADGDSAGGCVVFFPEVIDRPAFLQSFIEDHVSQLCPTIFPQNTTAGWTRSENYEIPKILELQQKIREEREESERKVAALQKQVEQQRQSWGFLHDLITAHDEPLRLAVKTALERIGFPKVIDVDTEEEPEEEDFPYREDLRLPESELPKLPFLLIEVKGILGLPRDADTLQVWKYIAPRMKQWGINDMRRVRGLAVVNHERRLPPLERQNVEPFRKDLLTNANHHDFGIMTAWDLFRLVRSYERNGWKHENVRGIFFRTGRIHTVPDHYELVGEVAKFYPQAGVVSVEVTDAPILLNDRIAFALPIEFVEQDVSSLQQGKVDTEKVESGRAGIKAEFGRSDLKEGTLVYRVKAG